MIFERFLNVKFADFIN